MSAARPLRLGIIGCGAVTEMFHLPATLHVPSCHVVALVDVDARRARLMADRWGVPDAAGSAAEITGRIDAAIVNTPPHTHAGIVHALLEAGIPVLCEKPLASSGGDARSMADTAARTGVLLAAGQVRRAYPNRQALRAEIASGTLGTIESVEISEGGAFSWPSVSGYMMQKGTGGGVLLDTGAHTLDEVVWLAGVVESIDYHDDALGGLESNVRLDARLAGGARLQYRLSRTRGHDNIMRVRGSRAEAVLSLGDWHSLVVREAHGERVITHQRTLTFPEIMAVQLRQFAQAVRGAGAPLATGEDGARVVELIERCYRSKAGRPLPSRAPLPGAVL